MGRAASDRPVLGTAIVGVFGLQVASTGWSEKRLRAAGRPYRAIHTHPAAHAGYYPGSTQISLKLLVDPDTDEILGAQGVGEAGVDKRIDVIATAITGGIRASELADLELAYAPQFGSAKDPISMRGWIASTCVTGSRNDPVARTGRRDAGGRPWWTSAPRARANAIPARCSSRWTNCATGWPRCGRSLVMHCAVGLRGYGNPHPGAAARRARLGTSATSTAA